MRPIAMLQIPMRRRPATSGCRRASTHRSALVCRLASMDQQEFREVHRIRRSGCGSVLRSSELSVVHRSANGASRRNLLAKPSFSGL